MAKVRQAAAVDLATAAFFLRPTIAGLAAAIRELAPVDMDASAVPCGTYSEAELAAGVPCAPTQHALLAATPDLRASLRAHHLAQAIRLHGRLDAAALEAALGTVAARHGALRTRFAMDPSGAAFLQAVGGPPPPPLLRTCGLPGGSDLAATLQRAAQEPFDLLAGPPWRMALLSDGAAEHVLLLVAHQAVWDPLSGGLLLEDLGAAYAAARGGSALDTLPAPPAVRLADVAAWQQERLDSGGWDDQLAFWRQYLAYAPLLLELPTDRPRPLEASGRAGWHVAASPAGLAQGLRALAADDASLFIVVLAAWKVPPERQARAMTAAQQCVRKLP